MHEGWLGTIVVNLSLSFQKGVERGEVDWCYDHKVFLLGFVPGVDSSLETWMMCEGDYEMKPPIHKFF